MKSFFSTTTIACLAFLLLCLPEGFSISDPEKNSPQANFNDEQGIILLGISIGEVSDPFMIINEGNDTNVDIEFTTSIDLPEGTTIEFEWQLNGESGLTNWNGSLLSGDSATHSVLDIPISNLEIGQVHNLLFTVISVDGELLTEATELTSTILINPEEDHFALTFDGIDDLVSITSQAQILPANDSFTIEFWFKTQNIDQLGPIFSNRQPIAPFNLCSFNINDGSDPRYIPAPGKKLTFSYGDASTTLPYRSITTVNDIVDGEFHHVAGVIDPSSQNLKLYVDGVEQEVSEIATGAFPTLNNSAPIVLGNNNNESYFTGIIDELRIWSTARTQQEVIANMVNNENLAQEETLIAWWDFGEAVGQTITDQVNQLEGELIGGVQFEPSGAPVIDFNEPMTLEIASLEITEEENNLWIVQEGQELSFEVFLSVTEPLLPSTELELEWNLNGQTGIHQWSSESEVSLTSSTTVIINPNELAVSELDTLSIEIIAINGQMPSGETNNSTLVAVNPEEDHFALNLTALNARIVTGTTLDVYNNFTMEFWINPVEPHEIDLQSNTGTSGAEGQHYTIYPDQGEVQFGSPNYAGLGVSAGTNGISLYEHAPFHIPALLVHEQVITGWTYVAIVVDNKVPTLFINGELAAIGEASLRERVYPSVSHVGGLIYGNFSGEIDEFRIWDYAKTSEEVLAGMVENETILESPELRAYWDFSPTGTDVTKNLISQEPATFLNDAIIEISGAPVLDQEVQGNFQLTSLIIAGQPVLPSEATTIVDQSETTDEIAITVSNDAVNELTSLTLNWTVNGVSQTPVNWTGSIASFDIQAITLTPDYIFEADSVYQIEISGSMPNGIEIPVTDTHNVDAFVIIQPSEDHFALDFAGGFPSDPNYGDNVKFYDASGVPTGNEPWTVEAWTKNNASGTLVQMGNSNSSNKFVRMSLNAPGSLGKPSISAGGSGQTITAQNNLELDKWAHVAATYDGDTMKLYVDGIMAEAKAIDNLDLKDSTVFLGWNSANSTQSSSITGYLDDVRVWNYERSAEEIRLNMSRFVDGADDEGLVFNLTMNPEEFDFPNESVTETASSSLGTLRNMPDVSVLVTPGAPVLDPVLQDDFKITSIVVSDEPLSPYEVTGIVNETVDSDEVSVLVMNNAVNTLSSLTLNWTVNGLPQTPVNWTGSIPSYEIQEITLTADYVFEADSVYQIEIGGSLPNGVEIPVTDTHNADAFIIIQPSEEHYAVDFANLDDYIRFFDASGIPTGNEAWTVEAWTKDNTNKTLLQVGQSNSSNKRILLDLNGSKPGIDLGAADQSIFAPDNIIEGKWTHIAGTYDGETLKLIVDGVLIEAKAISNLSIEDSTLYIGKKLSILSTLTGLLDNVRIWNYERSPEQIKLSMSRFIDPADDPGLVFNLTMNPEEFDFPNASVTETASASIGQLISMTDPSVLVTPGAPVRDPGMDDPINQRPDYSVNSVISNGSEVETGDSLFVQWDVVNEGTDIGSSIWIEKLYIESTTGQNRIILLNQPFAGGDSLSVGGSISRESYIVIPANLNIGDSGVVVVEIVPQDLELPNSTENNTGIELDGWNIKQELNITISDDEVSEGGSALFCTVFRTGSNNGNLEVDIDITSPERFLFSETVTIENGQSGKNFSVSAPDNSDLDGDLNIELVVSSLGFESDSAQFILVDDETPSLSLNGVPEIISEGEQLTFEVAIDLPSSDTVFVNLNTSANASIVLPEVVKIFPNELATTVSIILPDDDIAEPDEAVTISAGANGYSSALAFLSVVNDNDIPAITFQFSIDTISESSGFFATQGIISRLGAADEVLFVNLSVSLDDVLFIPVTVPLGIGEIEKTFDIGVFDDILVTGTRTVDVTASVIIQSCSCLASGTSAGSFTQTLAILDNDGPSIQLQVSPLSLPENVINAGTLTVSHNIVNSDPVEVFLAFSDSTEIILPSSVTIGEGENSVDIPITTLADTLQDGSQQVNITATSEGFNSTQTFVFVTDINKPDFVISGIEVDTTNVPALSAFSYRIFISNQGLSNAPPGVELEVFLSENSQIDANDIQLGTFEIDESILVGETFEFWNVSLAPYEPNSYKLIARVNSNNTISELTNVNNIGIFPEINILPDYSGTAFLNDSIYRQGDEIIISGTSLKADGSILPNADLEVYILRGPYRRELSIVTDSQGNYEVQFLPLPSEAGDYTVGASFPDIGSIDVSDQFHIMGFKVNNFQSPVWQLTIGDTLSGTLSVQNLSSIELTNLIPQIISNPPGASLVIDSIPSLSGNETSQFNFKVSGSQVTNSGQFNQIPISFNSDQSVTTNVTGFYSCQAQQAYLTSEISSINRTISAQQSNILQFEITNEGQGESGDIVITIPPVNFINLISVPTIESLSSGESAVIILEFTPHPDLPLNTPASGAMGITSSNGNFITIPYTVQKVSENTGNVLVDVVNEYTYFTEEEPHLENAFVKISNFFTGQVFAQGYTDSLGLFLAEDLPEGNLRIQVQATQHSGYDNVVNVQPGTQILETVFLSYQAISFSWDVVPTTIVDEYEVELIVEFETNVPLPVVIIDMPDNIPVLAPGETYSFNATLTNYGLITARDVEFSIPSDGSFYEFIYDSPPTDLLAQQSIQIPVTVQFLETPDENIIGTNLLLVSEYLGADTEVLMSNGISNENCSKFAFVLYNYECGGDGIWRQVSEQFRFEGEICIPPSNPIAPPGCPDPPCEPINVCDFIPCDIEVPDSDCDDCGFDICEVCPLCCETIIQPPPSITNTFTDCQDEECGLATLGAIATCLPSSRAAGAIYNALSCVQDILFNGFGLGAILCYVELPIKLISECLAAGLSAAAECAEAGIPGLSSSPTFQNVKSLIGFIGNPVESSIEVIFNTNASIIQNSNRLYVSDVINDLNEFETSLIQSGDNPADAALINDLLLVSFQYSVTLWMTEELLGSELASNESRVIFLEILEAEVSEGETIDTATENSILNQLSGFDIDPEIITAFISRYNLTVVANLNGVQSPNEEYPDIIDFENISYLIEISLNIDSEAQARGYTDFIDLEDSAINAVTQNYGETDDQGVCASVSVQISQTVTMTREAFEGTLTVFNGHPDIILDSLSLNLEILDPNGVVSNDLFEIETTGLFGLTGIDGTGQLNANQEGSAIVLFIPETGAAPITPISYSFGGTISYLDPFSGLMVELPLIPSVLQVNPSPDIFLHYFMQRDIYGDDPFTQAVEPIIPAELAVMIENNGFGVAQNVRIESSQPQIVSNENGLSISFNLIGSSLQGASANLGLTSINFGNIQPFNAKVGQWYFTSSLLGHFTNYSTNLVHSDSNGNPDLSLISGATLHELVRSISVYTVDDNINDFLVNDIQDPNESPDAIYLSQGSIIYEVNEAISGAHSGNILSVGNETTLSIQASNQGWTYIMLNDPGEGNFEIVSVTRDSDEFVLPSQNVWLRHITMPDSQEPIYENTFHFVDDITTSEEATYTVKWSPKDPNPPEVIEILGTPQGVTAEAVNTVTVKFSEAIIDTTFTYEDLILTLQGSDNIIDETVTITQLDSVTFDIDLSPVTNQNGFYFFTVQAAGVQDLTGTSGELGEQRSWTQYLSVPSISEYSGIPESYLSNEYDTLVLLFNLPMEVSTINSDNFEFLLNGTSQEGELQITQLNPEQTLFQLTGIDSYFSSDGEYEFVAHLGNMQSSEGVQGLGDQSILLKYDTQAPLLTQFTPFVGSGLDSQHNTGIAINFNEEIKLLDLSYLTLRRDGVIIPWNEAIEIIESSPGWYEVKNFGMLSYPEGEYTFQLILDSISDLAGNWADGTDQLTWTVNRTSSIEISDVQISPDLGISNTDGKTSGEAFTIQFTIEGEVSLVNVYQNNFGQNNLLASTNQVNPGMNEIAVDIPIEGSSSIVVRCFDALSNSTEVAIPIFIDNSSISVVSSIVNNSSYTSQIDSVQLTFSHKVLNPEVVQDAVKVYRGNTNVTGEIELSVFTEDSINFQIFGIGDLQQAGSYSILVQFNSIKKYLTGYSSTGTYSVGWILEPPLNIAPVANAGSDTIVQNIGTFVLNGFLSFDDNNDELNYSWFSPPGIELLNQNSVTSSFVITEEMNDSEFEFLLTVDDGSLIGSDFVTITVDLSFDECDIDSVSPIALSSFAELISLSCGDQIPIVPELLFADNCSDSLDIEIVFSEVTENDPSDCSESIIRTWLVSDSSNNTSEFLQVIEITDQTAPELACPDTIVLLLETGSCSIVLTEYELVVFDNCTDLSNLIVENNLGIQWPEGEYEFSVGETELIWTVTDCAGNQSSCSTLVTVLDLEPPVLIDVITPIDTICLGETPEFFTPEFIDNCGEPVNVTFQSTMQTGMNIWKWTATDGSGNQTIVTKTFVLESCVDPEICVEENFPNAPSNGLTIIENDSISLVWDPVPDASVCQIQGRLVGGTNISLLVSTTGFGPQPLNMIIPGVNTPLNLDFEWRVRCGCSADPVIASPWSEWYLFTNANPSNLISAGSTQFETFEMKLYPNPFNEEIILKSDMADGENTRIEVRDLKGRLLYSEQIYLEEGVQYNRIDLNDLAAGLYIVTVSAGTKMESQRIVKYK